MKLIVVEDEKIIRTGLLKHVPWPVSYTHLTLPTKA